MPETRKPPESAPPTPTPGESPAPTLKSLFAELYRELTSLDSRVWKTLRGLATPGSMARDWTRGRRDHVLPPIRLYLIASTVFFLTGGGLVPSTLLEADLAALFPQDRLEGFNAREIQRSVHARLTGWLALARMTSLIPFGLVLALWVRPGRPRVAPAFVLSMHFYTVAFLLAALFVLLVRLLGGSGMEFEVDSLGGALVVERALLLAWLVVGLRVFLERGWLAATLAALLLNLFDLFLLFLVFAASSGAMEVLIQS